jgi:hypothetical protein
MESKIAELKEEVQKEINLKNKPTSIYEGLLRNSLESMKNEIEEIEKALEVKKFNFIFIGKIGSGKTTAICHLFNLIGEFPDTKNGRQITKIEELFPTGSGRTTICEVFVKLSDKTYIEIDPYTEEELKELIEHFAEEIYSGEHRGESLSETQTSNSGMTILSNEVERALRNILNLRADGTSIQDGISKSTDLAKELCRIMKSEGKTLNDFKNVLLGRVKFNERVEKRIDYDSNGNEKKWIKDISSNLNGGMIENFSIPKRIFIYASPQVMDIQNLNFFDSVIDTKGLDLNKYRKDLDDYINADNTICFFASQFPAAPDRDIFELMVGHLGFKSKKYHRKFAVFVLPRNREPENVIGSNGQPIDDWDKGIQYRSPVVQNEFKKVGVNLSESNIIFYDSHRYYYNNRLAPDFTQDDVINERRRIMDSINKIIELREKSLYEDIDKLKNNFELILKGKAFTSQEEDIIRIATDKIKEFSNLNFYNSKEFNEMFIHNFSSTYPQWNTKHAINSRFGTYSERNIDIYYDGRRISEEIIKKLSNNFYKNILNNLDELKINLNNDYISALIEQTKVDYQKNYDSFIISVSQKIYEFLKSTTFYPLNIKSSFWISVIGRKGQGPGYNKDVLELYKEQLEVENKTENYLKNETETLWKIMVIDKLLLFFGRNLN